MRTKAPTRPVLAFVNKRHRPSIAAQPTIAKLATELHALDEWVAAEVEALIADLIDDCHRLGTTARGGGNAAPAHAQP